MDQLDLPIEAGEKTEKLVHHNLYMSPEHKQKLETLAKISGESTINNLRRAVHSEIDRMWRLVSSLG